MRFENPTICAIFWPNPSLHYLKIIFKQHIYIRKKRIGIRFLLTWCASGI